MAELLIELLSEEIPARMQARAADDLKRLVTERLKAADIAIGTAVAHVTPRRLVLVVAGLPERQPDRTEERKGPRVGAPDKAIEGFLRSVGLDSLDGCEQRAVGNATFWVVLRRHEGRAVTEVLPELIAGAIGDLPWPKSMRWADTTARWVRPLHSIVALLDGRPLSGGYSVGGRIGTVPFGDTTRGHRFHAPESFQVSGFADYAAKLRAAHVMLDAAERRDLILAGARRLCAAEGLALLEDGGLLDEVAGLVEWPVPLMGAIDPDFMEVPPEVLTTAMRTHQRYFSVRRPDGSLAPRFVLVANIEAADGGAAVVAGNERVLRARLSDAKFFWDQDRKVRLEDRLPALDGVVFHARLGSVGDKVRRLESLAVAIAVHIPGADPAAVATAARLAKADLGSGMVGEFPELQGVMGRYYARGEGQPEAVAEAIAQHYSPLGPNDSCPSAPEAVAVALADKIDTLAGFFAVGEKPTGSRDPYALRRAALGVIRLVLENGLRLPLAPVFAAARDGYGAALAGGASGDAVAADLLDFFADRLKVHLRERGVRHDLVAAVFALGGQDDLVRLLARVDALAAFAASDDGANLLVAYRRASNILAIEEKKDGIRYDGAPEPARFVQDEEAALASALERASAASRAALAAEDFPAAMAALAALRGPVDDFFEKVTVNAEDRETRANRLRLLSGIRDAMGGVADFSKLEG